MPKTFRLINDDANNQSTIRQQSVNENKIWTYNQSFPVNQLIEFFVTFDPSGNEGMFIYEMYVNSSCNNTQYVKENPNSKNVIYLNDTQILKINESMVKLLGNSTYNLTDQTWEINNQAFQWGIDITVPPSFWFENDARCQLTFEIGLIHPFFCFVFTILVLLSPCLFWCVFLFFVIFFCFCFLFFFVIFFSPFFFWCDKTNVFWACAKSTHCAQFHGFGTSSVVVLPCTEDKQTSKQQTKQANKKTK